MRTLILLALVGMTLTPATAAPPPAEVPDATLLSWAPVPGATHYTVHRGASPEQLVPIGETVAPVFLDDAPAPGLTVYAVTAWVDGEESDSLSPSQGGPACVQVFSGLRFRLNLRSCLRE